jgi:hypothetical protein
VIHDVVTGTGIDRSVYDPDFDSRHGKGLFFLKLQTGSGAHLDLC